jgi:hypothetical protein
MVWQATAYCTNRCNTIFLIVAIFNEFVIIEGLHNSENYFLVRWILDWTGFTVVVQGNGIRGFGAVARMEAYTAQYIFLSGRTL